MREQLRYLVVNKTTGNMHEGRDHAAKVYGCLDDARKVSTQWWLPKAITYEAICESLEKATAFCFNDADTHRSFLRALRNDPQRKTRVASSLDFQFIRWVDAPPPRAPRSSGVCSEGRHELCGGQLHDGPCSCSCHSPLANTPK